MAYYRVKAVSIRAASLAISLTEIIFLNNISVSQALPTPFSISTKLGIRFFRDLKLNLLTCVFILLYQLNSGIFQPS